MVMEIEDKNIASVNLYKSLQGVNYIYPLQEIRKISCKTIFSGVECTILLYIAHFAAGSYISADWLKQLT